jgi:hypothetical protein
MTAAADVPAQGLWAQVHATALEPALLSGPGVPAVGAALAGCQAAGQAAPGRGGQSQTCPGPTGAPSASPIFATTPEQTKCCSGACTQQKLFYGLPSAIGPDVIRRRPSQAPTRPRIAVRPAARRFIGYAIANVSGRCVARSEASAHVSARTRPPARRRGQPHDRTRATPHQPVPP